MINGKNPIETPEKIDVRMVPSGTLIYNLIRYSIEEIGIKSMLAQADQFKQANKLLVDPPQISAAREGLAGIEQARYAMATEINIRMASLDEMRIASIEPEEDEEIKDL